MRLYTAEQMRGADRAAMDAGVASVLLMEAAGHGVADVLLRRWPDAGRVLVLCGPGNNGGDGYVAARYLALAGRDVAVLQTTDEPSTEDAARAAAAWRALGSGTTGSLDLAELTGHLASADVVVDALLGSGLSRPLEGPLEAVVEAVVASGAPVLAVDVPTGVSADTAVPPGAHVRATVTAQLAGPKMSSALEPARTAYGSAQVIDIGIPASILEEASDLELLDADHPPGSGRARPAEAHKYSVGTVLVVAGSERYLGAAELACRGAYRAGAGLVTLGAEQRLPGSWPEIVFAPIDWDDAPLNALHGIESKRAGGWVVGPGLDPRAAPLLAALVSTCDAPLVLDAGALRRDEELRSAVRAHGRCVLTPHIGEAAELLDRPAGDVLANPIDAAREIADTWRSVVVLKGATTVIARPSGRAAVCTTGHPGLATGGAGDVLAGIVGFEVADAAPADADEVAAAAERAVWRHGRAGKRAAERWGVGLIASDVADAVATVTLD